jgi:hypothetical protein
MPFVTPAQKLLSRPDVKKMGKPAAKDLNALRRRCNVPLPGAIEELWEASDGLLLPTIDAELLGPAAVLALMDMADPESTSGRDLWIALLDDHQSDYMVTPLRGPVCPRVVHASHDGFGVRPRYYSVDSFLHGLIDLLDLASKEPDSITANGYFGDEWCEFAPDRPRSVEDRAAAKEILEAPNVDDSWVMAVYLLDASDLDVWKQLLETDHFVRRSVLERLRAINSPDVRELLSSDAKAFEAFGQSMLAALKDRGFPAVMVDSEYIRTGRGGGWRVESFFYRRNIPDAMNRLVLWIEDQLNGTPPRNRANDYFAD